MVVEREQWSRKLPFLQMQPKMVLMEPHWRAKNSSSQAMNSQMMKNTFIMEKLRNLLEQYSTVLFVLNTFKLFWYVLYHGLRVVKPLKYFQLLFKEVDLSFLTKVIYKYQQPKCSTLRSNNRWPPKICVNIIKNSLCILNQ